MTPTQSSPAPEDQVEAWIAPFVATKANARAAMPGIRDQRTDYQQKLERLASAFLVEHQQPMRIADLFGPAPDTLLQSFGDQRRRRQFVALRYSSRNAYRRVVDAFVTYLRERGLTGRDRVPWRMERGESSSLRTFSPQDVERMFTALNERDTIANRRLAALIAMALDHGARRGDALSLRLSTLDLDRRQTILSVKHDKELTVPLGPIAVRALQRYLAVRIDAGNHDLVFLTSDGSKPVSGNSVGAAFRRLLLQLGLVDPPSVRAHDDLPARPERLNFQTLRRTFVKHYLAAGRGERELIAILGWDREYGHHVFEYYTEVGIDQLAAMHDASSPLSRLLNAAA